MSGRGILVIARGVACAAVRRRPSEEEEVRASWAELFFDLVFVLVVTQLSAYLLHDLTVAGACETLFLLLLAWWAWIYTTWTTNWFDPDTVPVRWILLVGMLASMLGAVAIPDAFGDRGLLLVVGYVALQLVRNGFMVLATDDDDPLRLPTLRLFIWSCWVALIWIVGAGLEDETRVAVWVLALALDYAGPAFGHWTPRVGRTQPSEWELEPSHFTERILLFIIVALGESIVVTGVTASELPITTTRILAVMVAFAMTAVLWWLYFDYHAEALKRELMAAADERGRLGRDLTYIHIPMVAGIIVAAVANELVVAHPDRELHRPEVVAMAAGPMLYLLGTVVMKLRVLHARWQSRLVAAVLIAVLVPALGPVLPGLATWSIVLAVLAVVAWIERQERQY